MAASSDLHERPAPTAWTTADISRSELTGCLHLLAANLAEYRLRFGTLPLAETLRRQRQAAVGSARASATRGIGPLLREALELSQGSNEVFRPTIEQAPSNVDAERRAQPRVMLSAPLSIRQPPSPVSSPGTLLNLSWGGATFVSETVNVRVGEALLLSLPWAGMANLEPMAEVLRVWKVPDGVAVAVRFYQLGLGDERRIRALLEVLLSSPEPDGQRQRARLARRLELEVEDPYELKGMLHDISQGGARVVVPHPLIIDQQVMFGLYGPAGTPLIDLRARVTRQELKLLAGTEVYEAGLLFEHPNRELRRLVADLLQGRTEADLGSDTLSGTAAPSDWLAGTTTSGE